MQSKSERNTAQQTEERMSTKEADCKRISNGTQIGGVSKAGGPGNQRNEEGNVEVLHIKVLAGNGRKDSLQCKWKR